MTTLEALKIAKTMKRPIVYITDGYILGSDESFSVLSVITLNDFIEDLPYAFCGRFKDILYEDAKINKAQNDNPGLFFTYYEQVVPGIYVNKFEEYQLMHLITDLYRRCIAISNGQSIVKMQNLTNTDTSFASVVSLSSAEGMRFYRINAYTIAMYLSTFITIHPVTKSDIVNLECSNVDDRSFLAKFEIVKKKNLVIQEYIRYRYL